jgi:hypothetical protein
MTERLWDKKVQRDDEMYDSDEEIETKSRKMADNFGAPGILTAVGATSKNAATRQNKEQSSSEMPSGGVSTNDGASLRGRLPLSAGAGGVITDVGTNARSLENRNHTTSTGGIDEHVNTGMRRSVVSTAASAGQEGLAAGSNNRGTGTQAQVRDITSMDGDGDVDMIN